MRLVLSIIVSSSLTALLPFLGAMCDAFAFPHAPGRLIPLPSDAASHRDVTMTGDGTIHAHFDCDDDDDDDDDDDGDGRRRHVAALDRRSAVRLAMMTTTTTVAKTTLVASSAMIISVGGFAHAEDETMERGGVRLTPFNSLAFNYRGGISPTVDPASLDEPSIPYAEFLDRLNSDQVESVRFLAPNGDVAYVTFKSGGGGDVGGGGGDVLDGKRMRIGEGYPIEDPRGWSSPAFVVKAVARRGVPYEFVVPGLADSIGGGNARR